jgi:hypothetical protein
VRLDVAMVVVGCWLVSGASRGGRATVVIVLYEVVGELS